MLQEHQPYNTKDSTDVELQAEPPQVNANTHHAIIIVSLDNISVGFCVSRRVLHSFSLNEFRAKPIREKCTPGDMDGLSEAIAIIPLHIYSLYVFYLE